ncbi:hypothetical protein HDU81_010132, partial [Chytriomyces hyalinus]
MLASFRALGRRSFASSAAPRPASAATKDLSASKIALYVGAPLALTGALYYYSAESEQSAKFAKMQKLAASNPTPALDNPKEFKPFVLSKVEKLTPTTSRFVFELPEGTTELGLPTASCLLTRFDNGVKADGKPDVVIRPYTPIEDPAKGYTGTFDLVIKKYPNGPMSTHIFNLKRGDTLEMKGPILKYKYEANKEGHVGLIAGGTGITPMLQIIERALSDPKDETKLSLLFANVSEEEIILRDHLDSLAAKYKERFNVYYTVDKPSAKWTGGSGYINAEMLTSVLPKPGQGKVFVCGPGPMLNHVSGSKAPDYSQGEVGGLLAKLGYSKDDVFK